MTHLNKSQSRKEDHLRIAMLAPISWRTPPRHYGPWELVTSLLTEALVARGVDITLFATLDSRTAGKLAGVCPAPYSEDPSIDAKVWEILHVAHVFEHAANLTSFTIRPTSFRSRFRVWWRRRW